MKILALELSTKFGSIALLEDGLIKKKLIGSNSSMIDASHSTPWINLKQIGAQLMSM